MKHEYRIIGVCPFGNQEMDENGQMDETQFISSNPEHYMEKDGAGFVIEVLREYGIRPTCLIETQFCTIQVFKLRHSYGAAFYYITQNPSSEVYASCDIMWCNTVNPAAIVEYAWRNRTVVVPTKQSRPTSQKVVPMRIATHHEMENKWDSLKARIAKGEEVCTWSVQYGPSHADDLYNGTYAQCVEAAKRFVREDKRSGYNREIHGVALVKLNEDGCVTFCHKYVALKDIQNSRKD